MNKDQLAFAGVGIVLIGIGITMRRLQHRNWRPYVIGGVTLLVLFIVAVVFNWKATIQLF
jgi:uncharacterized membrane protein